jgi:hypothetical protein
MKYTNAAVFGRDDGEVIKDLKKQIDIYQKLLQNRDETIENLDKIVKLLKIELKLKEEKKPLFKWRGWKNG